MPLSVTEQPQAQNFNRTTTENNQADNGWSPLAKAAVPVAIAFTGIAAAYYNRDSLQNLFREQHVFTKESLTKAVLGVNLAVGVCMLIGLGSLVVYMWKRMAEEGEAISDYHQELANTRLIAMAEKNEAISEYNKALAKARLTFKSRAPLCDSFEEREPNQFTKLPVSEHKEPSGSQPQSDKSQSSVAESSSSEESKPKQAPEVPAPEHKEPEKAESKSRESDSKSTESYSAEESKPEIEGNQSNEIGADKPEDIAPEDEKSVKPDQIPPEKPSAPDTDTYDTLNQALIEAYRLIHNPDTKAYRKDGKIAIDDRIMSDYQARLKAYFKFVETLTDNADIKSQKLLTKAFDKLLGYSTLRAYELAIACIGKPAEGCRTIVKKAYKNLWDEAQNKEDLYKAKLEKTKNPVALEMQFSPLADKIRQYAGNFTIACIEKEDPDYNAVILEAFPLFLEKPSFFGLKFAITCLQHSNETCNQTIRIYNEELSALMIFEALTFEQKMLKTKTLSKLMAPKTKALPDSMLEDDFGLEDLVNFKMPARPIDIPHTNSNSLTARSVSTSVSYEGTATSKDDSDSLDHFNDITQVSTSGSDEDFDGRLAELIKGLNSDSDGEDT